MKRQYESMESFKVDFNLDEQVSAACDIYMGANKMTWGIKAYCTLNTVGSKYMPGAGGDDRCKVYEDKINMYA